MMEMYAGSDSSTQKRRSTPKRRIGLPIEIAPSVLSLHRCLERARLRKIEAFEAAEIESARGAHRKGYNEAARQRLLEATTQRYHQRRKEEEQGEQTIETNAKRCPQCRWYVQKKGGCEHVSQSNRSNFEILCATLLSKFIDNLPMSVRILLPLLGRLPADSSRRERCS